MKYDLLRIEVDDDCFPSSLYYWLVKDNQESVEEYQNKVHFIKQSILAKRNLLLIAKQNAQDKLIILEDLLRLHPQKHLTIPHESDYTWDSEDIFSILEEKTINTKILDEIFCLDNFTKSMPILQPLSNFSITSEFGTRKDPFNKKSKKRRFHKGIDLYAKNDKRVFATNSGTVEASKISNGYGNIITINHGDGFSTHYAHLDKIFVFPKEYVAAGQLIGLQGKTGRCTNEHLHYEIRFNNQPINPRKFLEFNYKCNKCIN